MCGYGYLRTGAGNEYVGEVYNNAAQGKGTYKWNTEPNKGDLYYGEWDNNNMHGQGVFVFSHGGTYVGGFRNHKKDTRILLDEDGDGIMEHQPGFLRMPNGDKFAVLFEEDEQITMDPIDDKRQQLENAAEEEKAMEALKSELDEEKIMRAQVATTAREESDFLKQRKEDAVKARAQAMLECSKIDGERKRFIERSERESDARMAFIIGLEADLEIAVEAHDFPTQEDLSAQLDEKRTEHRLATQKVIDQRENHDNDLEKAEREERNCKETATALTMEDARSTEDSDVKTKKARQVDMHLQRTEQLRKRAQLRKEFFTYWIEETKYRDVADEEAHKRDFSLDRRDHISHEVERRTLRVEYRQEILTEKEELKEKATKARDECAQTVLDYSARVDECRMETLARHDNELEEKLILLKKQQETAVDNLDYAEKELDRTKDYARLALKALEKSTDRRSDAERRMKAAQEEAGACEMRRSQCIQLAETEADKKDGVSEELYEEKQNELVEVPVVQEKVLEPKVMVGRSAAQRHWGSLRTGLKAAAGISKGGPDPRALTVEEQLLALNEVVDEELDKVHDELADQEAADRQNTDAKRWKMKYKYKYYYKYKAEQEEEVGMQQSQVLGDMWDIDPAVASLEEEADAAGLAGSMHRPSSPQRSFIAGRGGAMQLSDVMMESPPQLGRGAEFDDEQLSPDVSGEGGQVEFFIETEEVAEEPVRQIVAQSNRQAAAFLVQVHEIGLQNKQLRKSMIPQQRGMKIETAAWRNLLRIVNQKGAEETKAALRSKDVQAVTSKNVRPAVNFLAAALEAELEAEVNPMDGPMAPADRPVWDGSKTPEGRFRYLKLLDKQDPDNHRKILANPSLKSPDKVGWDPSPLLLLYMDV